MSKALSSHLSPRRSTLRSTAMNAGLLMLLAAVFLWSVAGNAIDTIRHAVEKRI